MGGGLVPWENRCRCAAGCERSAVVAAVVEVVAVVVAAPVAATQHAARLVRTCASIGEHMRADTTGRSEKAKRERKQRDEGSGFWLKYNLWRSHSMS